MYCEIPKLGRCCFCMPLRSGILIIGYLSLLNSAIGVILNSARIHSRLHLVSELTLVYSDYDMIDLEMNIAIYCIDVVFSVVLIYAAHRHIVRYLKVYFYYTLTMVFPMIILDMYFIYSKPYFLFEFVSLGFARWCLYCYLILLVRSLIVKLDNSGLTYENQLQEIISGEIKKDDTIYPSLPGGNNIV